MKLVGVYHEPPVPCHAPAEAEARKTVMHTRSELRVESPLSAGQVSAVELSLSQLGVTSTLGYSEIKRQKGHPP